MNPGRRFYRCHFFGVSVVLLLLAAKIGANKLCLLVENYIHLVGLLIRVKKGTKNK